MPFLLSARQRTLLIVISLTVFCSQAQAQRGQVSEADMLRRPEVRSDLGLSDDQAKKLDELLAASSPGREFFEPFLKRIAEAPREEQTKIREEMNEAVGKARAIFSEKAPDVLDASQKKKLRTMFLQSAGTRGLTDSRIVAEYSITEEQLGKLNALAEERRTASRELGFNASDEDRAKFDQEWQDKFLAVLTAEQKTRFQQESGDSGSGSGVTANVAGAAPVGPGAMPPGVVMPPPGAPSVMSFGSDAGPGERRRVDSFRFNFRYAPWDQVLQMFADGAGLTLDLNQVPPGTFSHLDDNSYTATQALDIMNGYLLRKGFCMVQKDNFLIVLNIDNGIPPSLIPDVTEEELLKTGKDLVVGDNQLVTISIPLEGMDTARAAQEVEAILGPQGSLIALTESQQLIITDVGANLRRVHGLLTAAMAKSKPTDLIFKSYHLKFIDAEEAEIQVMTQFGMRQNVANVSTATENQSRFRDRSGAPQQPGQPQTSRTQTPAATASNPAEPQIQVASDLRLNSLLVTGTKKQHELVESIISSLDVGEAPDGSPIVRGRKGTYLEVYQVKTADSGEVSKTLTAMNIPGVQVVNEDRRTGRIHIMATERQHEEVGALIRQLDGSGNSGSVAVINLSQMDPISASITLRSLFLADGDSAPTIEADSYGRRLIVRGSIDQITQIKQVLLDLGEDGTGVRQRGEGGNLRRFSLQGRDPDEFLKVLKQAWETQEPTKINIIVPEQQNPIRSRQTSEGEINVREPGDVQSSRSPSTRTDSSVGAQRDLAASAASGSQRAQSQWGQWQKPDVAYVLTVDESADQSSQTESAADDSGRSPTLPLRQQARPSGASELPTDQKSNPNLEVIVFGDELILSANDEEELDRLEDLLDTLQRNLPFKPEYTVYYLQAADAIEASDMLGQFFPSSSVASTSMSSSGSMMGSLGSSFSSMGSSLMDMTGLSGLGVNNTTLRIIPDARTNSLFMTGPPTMIRDAISFLKVLDSNDIPDSLKDMQPRQIIVDHADVSDVANVLKDVFKPYMEPQNQGRQQQQNPLAAMFGGGGGGGRGGNNEPPQVRMTLGVDMQNSILTVNSSQAIFEEVEGVVRNMDDAARSANRLIRVVQLKNADASMIQQSLTSLMPRVSVTSSRTNSGSSSGAPSGSGQPDNNNNNNNAQQEAFARMMQERMRQQQSGGGDRGSQAAPGGGRSGFGGFPGFGGGRGGFGGGDRGSRGGR